VHEDDTTLNWQAGYEALGVAESTTTRSTRQQIRKRKAAIARTTKNRHLMKVTRALLSEMKVPIVFGQMQSLTTHLNACHHFWPESTPYGVDCVDTFFPRYQTFIYTTLLI
jgi:hypothetical protein